MIKKLITTLSLGALLITTLIVKASAGTVTLAWDASPSTDVNRYKVYAVQGTNTVFLTNNSNAFTSVTVTNQLQATVTNLTSGLAWTFVATAISTNNLESSNSISIWTYIQFPKPSPPSNPRFLDITP